MRYENQPASFLVQRSFAGLGLFARTPFRRGDFIIEYTGERISLAEADRRGGRYLFEINTRLVIDGSRRDNLARYINHSCRPNAKAETRQKRVLIFAKRPIRPGEEITYHYGKEYVEELIKPYGCRCGACAAREYSL